MVDRKFILEYCNEPTISNVGSSTYSLYHYDLKYEIWTSYELSFAGGGQKKTDIIFVLYDKFSYPLQKNILHLQNPY